MRDMKVRIWVVSTLTPSIFIPKMVNQIFQSLMTLYDFLISHSIATPALWIFQMDEIPARITNRPGAGQN
jgi:hypothetical protein